MHIVLDEIKGLLADKTFKRITVINTVFTQNEYCCLYI